MMVLLLLLVLLLSLNQMLVLVEFVLLSVMKKDLLTVLVLSKMVNS